MQTGQQLLNLKGPSDGFSIVTFSPDGKRLVTTDGNSMAPLIKVCDAQTGQVMFIFQGHTSWIRSVVFSPDGKFLASSSNDRTLRIWELQTSKEIRTLRGHTASSLAFSSDGRRLALAGGFDSVKVWDWDVQKEQETLNLKGIRVASSLPLGASFVVFILHAAQNEAFSGQLHYVLMSPSG